MKVYNFKCNGCGSSTYKKIDKNTYKCEYCGTEEVVYENQKNTLTKNFEDVGSKVAEVSKRVNLNTVFLLIMCAMFGVFGVHKFCEHKIILGILYLITFGFFGVGYTIDIIKYIFDILHQIKGRKSEQDNLYE